MKKFYHGRYHDLVLALVRHSNSVSRVLNTVSDIGGVGLTMQEYQLLEAVCECEDENYILSDYAEHLALPLSSVSKMASRLVSVGLAEKYRLSNNKKNIILKPSKKGSELYHRYFEDNSAKLFQQFYARLETIPDEYLADLTDAVDTFSGHLKKDAEDRLIEIVKVIE